MTNPVTIDVRTVELERASRVWIARQKAGEAGARWIRARDERDRLEKERNEILCKDERMLSAAAEDGGVGWMYRSGDACWKGRREQHDEGGSEWVTNREPDEWCENCKRRTELHQQYVRARARAASLRGALTRACVKAAEVEAAP